MLSSEEESMKRKKDIITTIILILIMLVGLSVMLYPTFSDWWNKNKASHVISNYQEAVAKLDNTQYDKLLAEAQAYNKQLAGLYDPFTNFDAISGYEEAINVSGSGIIGYITIPAIRVELPIYHGTSEGVLNVAIGHLQGSSLPVGGANTHAVLSGHRGLPSARLFTDLDDIVVGDTFTLNVLNEVFTYEVEEIFIVRPEEMEKLAIIPGGDYVTLMTCTPYGVNTHRLLIRSHRINTVYEKQKVKASADAVQVDPMLAVPVIAVPLLIGLFVFWGISGKSRKRSSIKSKYKVM